MKIPFIITASVFVVLSMTSSVIKASVIQWDYITTGEFTASSFTGSDNIVTSTSLAWGLTTGSGSSSLVIDNSTAFGTMNTYTGSGTPPASFIGTSFNLTHNNNPIQPGTTLSSATLRTTVKLKPAIPNQPGLPDQLFNFDIKFVETPNSGTCADITSPVKCNDIFILEGGLPNFQFDYDAGDSDGLMTYFVNGFVTDSNALSVLDNAICAAAGVANGCIGLTTVEKQSNLIPFGFTISTQPFSVPEPTGIALMGLSLLLLGFRSKLKNK